MIAFGTIRHHWIIPYQAVIMLECGSIQTARAYLDLLPEFCFATASTRILRWEGGIEHVSLVIAKLEAIRVDDTSEPIGNIRGRTPGRGFTDGPSFVLRLPREPPDEESMFGWSIPVDLT